MIPKNYFQLKRLNDLFYETNDSHCLDRDPNSSLFSGVNNNYEVPEQEPYAYIFYDEKGMLHWFSFSNINQNLDISLGFESINIFKKNETCFFTKKVINDLINYIIKHFDEIENFNMPSIPTFLFNKSKENLMKEITSIFQKVIENKSKKEFLLNDKIILIKQKCKKIFFQFAEKCNVGEKNKDYKNVEFLF